MNDSGFQTHYQKSMSRAWRKIYRLTRGRIPILRALEIVTMEETEPSIKEIFSEIKSSIEAGCTLSEAAEKSGRVSLSIIELLKAAEKTGAWDEIFMEIIAGIDEGIF